MTHIEQVAEAITKLTGLPFEPSRGQRTELREGETTEAVIASLPLQIADLRGDIARQLSEVTGRAVPVDVIEPWMVAHMLVLDAPVTGFSGGSVWRDLRPNVLFELGARIASNDAIHEVSKMHWIVALYLEHDNRLPDAEGFATWLGLLADGHNEDTVRGWIINGFAK